MSANEWITNRLPTYADARRINATHLPDHEIYGEVWVWQGQYRTLDWKLVKFGDPWQPITTPEPYVKPKRYTVDELSDGWCVYDELGLEATATYLPTREAAEEIAAIYERATP